MPTLILDPAPAQLEALLEHRRETGADIFDEVWEGVYHLTPSPNIGHSLLDGQLVMLLTPTARAAGLLVSGVFNLGRTKDDFRIPDLGVHRGRPHGTFIPTAAIVVEIVSPGDESWKKLPFYARHGVDEVLIVDPAIHSVSWLALQSGEYRASERSRIIDLGANRLAERIDWPPVE